MRWFTKLTSTPAGERRAYGTLTWSTFAAPFVLASLYGAATGKPWSFYVAVLFLAMFPPIMGAADLIVDFVERAEQEKARRAELRRRHAIVENHGGDFVRQLGEQSYAELWLMDRAVEDRKRGFTKEPGDAACRALIERGLVYIEEGFTPSGFPYYFTEQAWVLMTELAHAVAAQRARHSERPPAEHIPSVARDAQAATVVTAATLARALSRGAMFIVLSLAATVGVWAAFAIVVIGTSFIFIFGGRLLAAIAGWFFGAL
jgi:hypothetical protein